MLKYFEKLQKTHLFGPYLRNNALLIGTVTALQSEQTVRWRPIKIIMECKTHNKMFQ